jgi:hypothetical protein
VDKHVIRKLTKRDGDTLIAEWTPGVKEEEAAAADKFNSLVGGGFMIFQATTGTAVREGPIRTFDPQVKEYLVSPRFVGG